MAKLSIVWLLLLAGLAGCSDVYVSVDCRRVSDPQQARLLDGPTYQIRSSDEAAEATLAFQQDADLLERILTRQVGHLRRVPAGSPCDLVVTIACQTVDRGTDVVSSPVYGHRHLYFGGGYGCGSGWGSSFGLVGMDTRTVHRGFRHTLLASVWRPELASPGGRQVLWEAHATCVSDEPGLRQMMPYLMLGLVQFYGEQTDEPSTIKINAKDLKSLNDGAADESKRGNS